MSTSYSSTPLARKLGIKSGIRLVVVGAPWDYSATLDLPSETRIVSRSGTSASFIHLFVRSSHELARRLPALVRALDDTGMLWVSWPKQSSGVATDLSENPIRALGLAAGLVDVKVCAVDEVWSGLKFVRRLKDRGGR